MIRSMLYATDLGLYAPYVMQHALALARTFKADLYVIHVVEPIGLFAESVLQSYLDEAALSEWQSQGLNTVMATIEQRVLDSFREELGEGEQDLKLIRSVRVIQGDPCEVILDQLRKLSVDLLIVAVTAMQRGRPRLWDVPRHGCCSCPACRFTWCRRYNVDAVMTCDR